MTKEQAAQFFKALNELQAQLDALKQPTSFEQCFPDEPEPVCDGLEGCGCGCDEPETEEKVILRRGEVITAPEDEAEIVSHELATQAQVIVFTRAELVEFATKLTERVVTAAKEAVTDTSIDADDLVSLELNVWNGNTIDIELDKDKLVESIHSEIDDAIDTDEDAVENEITDILSEMYSELQS
jgi:transcription-repair coupling factor (superfamily II helicase)